VSHDVIAPFGMGYSQLTAAQQRAKTAAGQDANFSFLLRLAAVPARGAAAR
jgi:hypothetical protein